MPRTDQHVIVTGATSGIGLTLTERLAQLGHPVYVCARSADALADLVASLRDKGLEVDGSPCDVTSPEQIRRFVEAAVDRYGPVGILVNNAGRSGAAPPRRSTTTCGSTSSTPTSTACSS